MTGDTMTPNGFLLARIAEDEVGASMVLTGPIPVTDLCALGLESEDAELFSRWNGSRVLAECDAKRRIVELHWRTAYLPGDDPDDGCIICGGWPCDTLRALALPYADHPDFPAALTGDVNVR